MNPEKKLSLSETIKQIEQYIEAPGQCPLRYIQAVVGSINPKYTAIALAHIGGEGIVIKSLDETKEKICLKIARTDAQLPPTTRAVNIYKLLRHKKEENLNVLAERFKEGAIIQRRLYKEIVSEKINFFSIPQIQSIATSPLLYMQMEWVESPNILFWLNKKNSLTYSMSVFLKLLGAVRFWHERGIIHRDLKSENILIGEKDSVVILDWNLSKEIGDRGLTVPGTAGGTVGYAPIKFMKDGDFSRANYLDDIYSLGFVFWEFVTQKKLPLLPREEYSDRKIEEYRKYLVTFLPDIAQPIFWKATEQKEKGRYRQVKEFQEDIHGIIEYLKENIVASDVFVPSVFEEVNEVDQIVDTSSSVLDRDIEEITKCKECGICKGAFPCVALRKEILEIVFKMKEKGILS